MSFGLFYHYLLVYFESGKAVTAFAGSLCYGMFYLTGEAKLWLTCTL